MTIGKAKRPRDPVQLAKQVFDIAIGETEDTVSELRHPDARRAGGLKGGKARAKSLTPEQRRKIASDAAQARWQHLRASTSETRTLEEKNFKLRHHPTFAHLR